MKPFVRYDSVVREIWGASDTILFVFAGSAAEFALNKSVDWLYFTGRLPKDPIGRLFSTVEYARRIVFASEEDAHAAIDQITKIHQGVEKARGSVIPPEAYRDVLYMLIHYSIASFELLRRRLTDAERTEVYDVFYRMGLRMAIPSLPETYGSWLQDRARHMEQDLVRSAFTVDLFQQYRKHLGAFRYRVLIEAQKLVVPPRVFALMQVTRVHWLRPSVPVYRVLRRRGWHQPVRTLLLPSEYRAQIDALDITPGY
jgi:uncharacterized protein (DUF2236 family)